MGDKLTPLHKKSIRMMRDLGFGLMKSGYIKFTFYYHFYSSFRLSLGLEVYNEFSFHSLLWCCINRTPKIGFESHVVEL